MWFPVVVWWFRLQTAVCNLHSDLDRESLMGASCGQSGRVTMHGLWRCMGNRTAAHGRSVQILAGHEATVHQNSIISAQALCAHSSTALKLCNDGLEKVRTKRAIMLHFGSYWHMTTKVFPSFTALIVADNWGINSIYHLWQNIIWWTVHNYITLDLIDNLGCQFSVANHMTVLFKWHS